jgi:hypothetical protein
MVGSTCSGLVGFPVVVRLELNAQSILITDPFKIPTQNRRMIKLSMVILKPANF